MGMGRGMGGQQVFPNAQSQAMPPPAAVNPQQPRMQPTMATMQEVLRTGMKELLREADQNTNSLHTVPIPEHC